MTQNIREAEKSIGKVKYDISKDSKKNLYLKRSIYFSKKIKKGEILSKENIKVVRPALSLSPKYYYKILGKKVRKNFNIGDRIYLKDLYK